MQMFKPLIGSDPEGFIRSKKTGRYTSCHNMLPGTKKEPYKVPGGAIQVDGVAAEINIDPAANYDEWHENHAKVIKELKVYLGESYELVWVPVAFFDTKEFEKLPAETQALGCDPDWNAWTGKQNPPPNAKSDKVDDGAYTFRCAGGHVHVGITSNKHPDEDAHRQVCFNIVKFFDVGVAATTSWDENSLRRKLYGKPGACRIKPYGPECRVLSNVWMQNEKTMREVYYKTLLATWRAIAGRQIYKDQYDTLVSKLAG